MKYFYLLLMGCAAFGVSCKSNSATASTNPYQSNPYYGPSGSSYGTGSSDYSSTPSSVSYPSYSESTYTPPASASSIPSVPSTPTYSSSDSYTAPSYTPAPSTSVGGGGSSHTVASGENLYRISLKYGTSVAAIKSANGLTSDTIRTGQVLKIP